MSDGAATPVTPAAPPAPTTPSAPTAPPAAATPANSASLSTLTQPLAAVPPEPEIKRVPLGRLSAVEIRNYRAYRGTFRIELPKGENLLIYGENGAGKSSLFHTLRTFLEAPGLRVVEKNAQGQEVSRPIKITDDQHRFTPAEPGVKLEFGERIFEWTNANNDTGHEIVRLVNQAKGFLDYKALLDVHHVRSGEKPEIDLFPLLIQSLLPHYTYSHRGVSRTFKERWAELQKEVKRTWRWSRRQKEPEKDFLAELKEFNEALKKAITDLGARASALLASFGDEFQVEFRYMEGEFDVGPKRIEGPKVLAVPAFRKLQCSDYHSFLNEARLSALAICLFFAALKESPATGLRLLVLDDILIGLDMANRVKVVDLIRDHFQDWQIIILTYSKAWFERLKDHVKAPGWPTPWLPVVFWEDWRGEDTSPYIVAEGSGDLLEMAANHLKRKDYKAAAVYARSALEALCHHTCAKASLSVLHVESPKDRKVEHYWIVLKARISEIVDDNRRTQALQLIARLEQAREFVLNRNAHFDVEEEDTLSGEVGAALDTVNALKLFFAGQPWAKENFLTGRQLSALEEMQAHIAAAHQAVAAGAFKQCRGLTSQAFFLCWLVFGAKIGVLVPLGAKISAHNLWVEAAKQKKLAPEIEARLNAARPYLFGTVKPKEFKSAEFEKAVKLLEELSAPPVTPHPGP